MLTTQHNKAAGCTRQAARRALRHNLWHVQARNSVLAHAAAAGSRCDEGGVQHLFVLGMGYTAKAIASYLEQQCKW